MSIQARDCKVQIFINEKLSKDLSGDATNGLAATLPLMQDDLLKSNKISITVSEAKEDPYVALNLSGIIIDRRQVISTGEKGNLFSLTLDAKKILASKTKVFSSHFETTFAGRYEPIKDMAPAWKYVHYLLDLINQKDADKFAAEVFDALRKNKNTQTMSDAELKKLLLSSIKDLFSTGVIKKINPKGISLFPFFGGLQYKLTDGQNNLVQYHNRDENDSRYRGMPIRIGQINGKIQVVSFFFSEGEEDHCCN